MSSNRFSKSPTLIEPGVQYFLNEALKRADVVSDKVLREYIFDYQDEEGCLACEG